MIIRTFHAVLLSLLLGQTALAADATVEIHDPWVRSAPPNARVMAGYLHLVNHGDSTIQLHGVSSPQFDSVELHRTMMHDNVAHMEQMDTLTLGAGEQVQFEPGGLHLMLIKPHQPLPRGTRAELTFEFDDGTRLTLEAEVRDSATPMGHGEHGGHQHH